MVLIYLCAKRSNYHDFENYRDTAELLKGIRLRDVSNPPTLVDTLRKRAFDVMHHFHPDQIERMDPVLRNHLRLDPVEDGSEPSE